MRESLLSARVVVENGNIRISFLMLTLIRSGTVKAFDEAICRV